MTSKYLFGLFTFALGAIIGMFLNRTILSLFPEDMDAVLKGVILIVVVILFYAIWRLSEKFSNKKGKTDTTELE